MREQTSHSWPGWETVRLIGRGSFGAVYEIQRDVFGDVEKAALKVISIPQNSSDIDEMYSEGYDEESITTAFQSHLKNIVGEYSLMRKMNGSANVVNCDDLRYVRHEDGIGWDIFIKMELLTPLTRALPAAIPEETVIRLGRDLCAALELCKKHGIIHRDIKPKNIFLSDNGDYKLGDFGIAKTVEKTMGGTKTGTYKYMAPEVYNNQPYGHSADIYSLGLVLYWMLNERRMPFQPLPPEKLTVQMDEHSRNRRLCGEPLPEPKNGSDKLKAIVLKACAYDPKERYASAAAMRADLERLETPRVWADSRPEYEEMPEISCFVPNTDEEDKTVGLFFRDRAREKREDEERLARERAEFESLRQVLEVSEQTQKQQNEKKRKWDEMVARQTRLRKKDRIVKVVTLVLLFALAVTVLVLWVSKENRQKVGTETPDVLVEEAQDLIARADVLAKGYNYDEAIALLDSFSADKSQYPGMLDAYNAINDAKSKVKPIDDPGSIPNLSFHCLIADPARAFSDKDYGKFYNTEYVTIDEFSKILDQLHAGGYVLVDFDSFILETVGEDGKVTYSAQPIFLPEGKKPIMITETLVNYETFSIDSDGDGEADKGGDGFASKLVVRDGKIVNEYVDADGNTLYGAYDLVPILEAFIEEHPDFCYRGARATLAVSGEDGVFGYRIMHSVKESKGKDYYNQQVEGAKAIAEALRDRGYTIACYTYANVAYGTISATNIQVDLDNWKKEVKPVLGDVPILVYAKASDISAEGNYEGGKYNVLKGAGFRYFISSANVPYAEVTVNYVRQSRIMVTGQQMITSAQVFSNYFDAKSVLNEFRDGK